MHRLDGGTSRIPPRGPDSEHERESGPLLPGLTEVHSDRVAALGPKEQRRITEVNMIGGHERQYVVAPRSTALLAFGLTLEDLATALERLSAPTQPRHFAERSAQRGSDVVTVGELLLSHEALSA